MVVEEGEGSLRTDNNIFSELSESNESLPPRCGDVEVGR